MKEQVLLSPEYQKVGENGNKEKQPKLGISFLQKPRSEKMCLLP